MTNYSPENDGQLLAKPCGLWGLSASAIAFLALTAVLALLVSHYTLLWFDEYLMLNTDSVGNLQKLIEFQRTAPISLDPFAYHLFSYLSMRIFGANAFALRLPSILGYLLMQACLYLFVRRIATERAALFAMILPSLLHTQSFVVDGRPYGMQLGLYALALVCWQTAVRRDSNRTAVLVTMAVALAIAVNTHYFAFLLLIPLYAAEAVRALHRRRLDLPMLAALGVGTAAMGFLLPFSKGAAVFRDHYIALNVDLHAIPLIYRSLLVFPTVGGEGTGRHAFLAVLMLAFVWGAIRLMRRPVQGVLRSEYVVLITLAALPFFGYLLAVFVTHSIYERYVICTVLGMTMLEALAISSVLQSRWLGRVVIGVMLALVVLHGVQHVREERSERRLRMAQLQIDPAVMAEVKASPSGLLYMQDMATFFFTRFYEPDAEIRSRLALVDSREQELRIMHQDTYWLQASHLGHFTDARVVPYEVIAAEPGGHIFLNVHDQFQWLDTALAGSQATVTYLGPGYGPGKPMFAGDFVSVAWPQAGR